MKIKSYTIVPDWSKAPAGKRYAFSASWGVGCFQVVTPQGIRFKFDEEFLNWKRADWLPSENLLRQCELTNAECDEMIPSTHGRRVSMYSW